MYGIADTTNFMVLRRQLFVMYCSDSNWYGIAETALGTVLQKQLFAETSMRKLSSVIVRCIYCSS